MALRSNLNSMVYDNGNEKQFFELDSAKFSLRVKPLCITPKKEHPFPKRLECSKLTESNQLSQYAHGAIPSS